MKKPIIALALVGAMLFPLIGFAQTIPPEIQAKIDELNNKITILMLQLQLMQLQQQLADLQASSTAQQITNLQANQDTFSSAIENNLGMPVPPVDEWVSLGQFMVGNGFAVNGRQMDKRYGEISGNQISASSTSFTLSGRLLELRNNASQQTSQKWFPVVSASLTIKYGDQSQTGTTDSDGNVTLTFHPIGVPGEYHFEYSTQSVPLNDCKGGDCGAIVREY